MFGRSIKTVPLFELFAHVIPVKSLFLDPVIDHIASLAVNFQGDEGGLGEQLQVGQRE